MDQDQSKPRMMRAKEVAAALQISVNMAYTVIRRCNEQLKSEGYMTFRGRVDRRFFEEQFLYGGGAK